ncbi:MAG: transcription-repair coupling factor [Chloroflexota bacterium]|nr:transcription-repair coupling factor [Chloroflexota bacterium]
MLKNILSTIQEQRSFQEIIENLQDGVAIPNLALPRAARLSVLTALHRSIQTPILLLTDRSDHALVLNNELSLWSPETTRLTFPEPDPPFYENTPWGENTRRDRLSVLTTLAAQQIPTAKPPSNSAIIIATARAVMTRTLPRRDFIKNSHTLKTGQIAAPNQLTRKWVKLGYTATTTVTTPGQFARRGGILDLWPPADPHPTRIELFGDEIDTLRHFDPSTQRTIQHHSHLLIPPAREFIPGAETPSETSEFHIPVIHPHAGSIFDYLPRKSLVIIDNVEAFQETIFSIEKKAISLRKNYIAEGILSEDYPIPYITYDQLEDILPRERLLFMGPSASSEGLRHPLAAKFSPNPRFGGRLKSLMEHLTQSPKVIVVSRQADRLQNVWNQRYRGAKQNPTFIKGSLTDGWALTLDDGATLQLFTDGEIFGWQRPQPRRRHRPKAETPEAAYADLQSGDWVVHIDHGIGKFIGLMQRAIEGAKTEYLCIEYDKGDRLFVPVGQADRLSPYIGASGRAPTADSLGSARWTTVKSRVKKAVEDIAEDLLALYAKRRVVSGYAFSPDTHWQQELEASFPYFETEDQLRALAEVKQDMEAPRPMDRLICGDVGFGKTEIALRAAFKAVMDGKQVAILVPTTVLAQQHYYTFRERLTAFPVEVEMLSRFRTRKQQENIIFRAAQGAVDILIGTHRLLSGDVEFNDLGLLIIDEEQRFGVTHKEKLKHIRTEMDVLTLTATPIPRTLYMALTGLRDISTLDIPPDERLPIITHVGTYSKKLIRRAILRELERGGQVFFVHNRVKTIRAMKSHLSRLVPEARIGIAHGQMPEAQLAQRMREFTSTKIDVLLSTSIIESGLDIPNANTLIVDRADTFGLAQLYQLRGRVGRGAQRAYAYFFKHKRKIPTPVARQRLETLAENVQLGAGFTIAMRDLEIRGAGDILGKRQHGQIASVGFHLYTRLLAEAVKHKRDAHGMPLDKDALALKVHRRLVTVDLPLHTTIPSHYVPEREMRLKLYRRLADIQSLGEINVLREEFQDRFGELPAPVENLLLQLRIKLLARAAGLKSVSHERNQIALKYPEGAAPPRSLHAQNVSVGKSTIWIQPNPIETQLNILMDILNQLVAISEMR